MSASRQTSVMSYSVSSLAESLQRVAAVQQKMAALQQEMHSRLKRIEDELRAENSLEIHMSRSRAESPGDETTDIQARLQALELQIHARYDSKIAFLEQQVQNLPADALQDAQESHAELQTNMPDQQNRQGETDAKEGTSRFLCQRHYEFEECVYDAVLFSFTKPLGFSDSIFIILSFVVNFVMQMGVVGILSMQFTADPLPEDLKDGLLTWRVAEGHSYRNRDAVTGTSLVARICAMDSGLSVSTRQLSIWEDGQTYLDSYDTGKTLCNIAIILWTFTCALDVRRAISFLLAVCHVPRSKHWSTFTEDLEEVHVNDLTIARVLLGCGVALCRGAVAILLLFYGSWWLAYTVSVKDLLLNASALGFVLDIDNIIFCVLAPMRILGLIDSVQPLTLPSAGIHSYALPLALGTSIVVFVLMINLTFVEYISTQYQLINDVLCSQSSNVDFLVGSNDFGRLFYAKSTPYDQAEGAGTTAQRKVIQLIMQGDPEVSKFAGDISTPNLKKNGEYLQSHVEVSLDTVAKSSRCADFNGAEVREELGNILYVVSGDETLQDVKACAEVEMHCAESGDSLLGKNVRLLCPVTCGCGDPMSGLWNLASHQKGCPWKSCRLSLSDLLSEQHHSYGCQDKSLAELQALPGWSRMLHLTNPKYQESAEMEDLKLLLPLYTSIVDDFHTMGCKGFQSLSFFERLFVCGLTDPMRKDYEDLGYFFAAGVMCPESCGCYFDYNASWSDVPDVFYLPGQSAFCPMRSCKDRFIASAAKAGVCLEFNGTEYTVCGDDNQSVGGDDGDTLR